MTKRKILHYVLEPVYEPEPTSFMNAAVGMCGLCGGMAAGMGASFGRDICLRCAEVVISGQAKGAIKWDEIDT